MCRCLVNCFNISSHKAAKKVGGNPAKGTDDSGGNDINCSDRSNPKAESVNQPGDDGRSE